MVPLGFPWFPAEGVACRFRVPGLRSPKKLLMNGSCLRIGAACRCEGGGSTGREGPSSSLQADFFSDKCTNAHDREKCNQRSFKPEFKKVRETQRLRRALHGRTLQKDLTPEWYSPRARRGGAGNDTGRGVSELEMPKGTRAPIIQLLTQGGGVTVRFFLTSHLLATYFLLVKFENQPLPCPPPPPEGTRVSQDFCLQKTPKKAYFFPPALFAFPIPPRGPKISQSL